MLQQNLKIKTEHMAENNYLFIHIPKTGGRSVLSAMGIKFHCEHKSLQEYIKDLTEPVVRSRYKFTIIRNPWDRAVSWYRFFYKPMPNEIPLTFEQWVLSKTGGKMNNRTDNPSFNRVKIPLDVLSYCRNASGELLMDKYLRFEHLNEDFKEIATKFNITTPLPTIGNQDQKHAIQTATHLIKMNKQAEGFILDTSTNYKDLYKSQESIDTIANMNQELITKFNYSF